MQLMKPIMALLAPLLLASCWGGEAWYDAKEGEAVLPSGDYRLIEIGAKPEGDEVFRVTQNADGSLSFKTDTDWRVVTVPFGPRADRRYIAQAQKIEPGGHDRDAMFLLLEVRDGRYLITVLPCSGAARAAVERSGGTVSRDPNSASSCDFRDRATLEEQLKAFVAAQDRTQPEMELLRVGV
jgi:hypothetical protein